MCAQLNNIAPISLNVSLNDTSKLLKGLGKATRRGIKKCAKCGSYNGTRSSVCKNKQCGTFLKDSEDKLKDLDAVKLITGTVRQVYSVRVVDSRNCRGFVQLPLLHSEDANNILSKVALCFVESCQTSFDDSILKCHEEESISESTNSLCVHINAALKSCSMAIPIQFKNEVLNRLNIPEEVKQNLFLLAKETEGPLVQRVSNLVMAVKCQVTPKYPVGYLHFTFEKSKTKEVFEKFSCECNYSLNNEVNLKCIHYYACICALASDTQYFGEFFNFISTSLPANKNILSHPPCTKPDKVKINSTIKRKAPKQNNGSLKKNKAVVNLSSVQKCKPLIPKILPVEIKVLNTCQNINEFNEIETNGDFWRFIDWLSFVTESINNTMKFENCGITNTLIFHIPENFYRCFKKRIPLLYCSGERSVNDSAAFYIMNILHLKEIFDTPKIKLRISKKFIQTEQNCYIEYDEMDEQSDVTYKSTFIFFLNVGQSTVDESDNTNNSFFIEWLPNISTILNIGQLKLQYKYGRKST